jgi:hypothetical protein
MLNKISLKSVVVIDCLLEDKIEIISTLGLDSAGSYYLLMIGWGETGFDVRI